MNQAAGQCGASRAEGGKPRFPLQRSNNNRRRSKRREAERSRNAAVFSQGLLADTKSAFVCLPGCQIKEFLCVGGSDRVYLTLQLLL